MASTRTRSGELFSPMNIAAYVTWCAVMASVLGSRLRVPEGWPVPDWSWPVAVMLLFIGAFIGIDRVPRESPGRNGRCRLLLGVQMLAAIALTLMSRNGSAPILLIIVMAQMPSLVSMRTLVASAVLIDLVLYAILAGWWGSGGALVATVSYAGFQAFAVLSSVYALRAEAACAQLTQVNAHLMATRALLDESARDAERLKLARELHDVAGHKLTALKLNLANAARDPRGAQIEGVLLSAQLADELLGDIRGVVREMRRHDGLDLGRALAQLAEPIPHPQVHVQVSPDARVAGVPQAEAIVRAAQEGLTNAARHAGAEHVWIVLGREGARITLDVRDDGRGAASLQVGSGLAGMRERLEALGGGLRVASRLGEGFALHAWLPAEQPA